MLGRYAWLVVCRLAHASHGEDQHVIARFLTTASPAAGGLSLRSIGSAVRWTLVAAGALGAPFVSDLAAAQAISFGELRAAAVDAMGGVEVDRIEIAGSGWDACLGQAWNVNEGWARWELTDYRRVIDYAEAASLQTAMRRPAMDPERVGGCGAQPGGAASRQQSRVDGASAWPDQLPIWLTPHGFLRLAENGETSVAAADGGVKVTVRVPRDDIVYTFDGYYDEDYRLERIETWIDDSVFGDMSVEAEFGGYRSFGGIVYPESLVYKQGGLTTLSLTFDEVVPGTQAETSVASGPPRAGGGGARPAESGPSYVELGDGVFVMLGAYQGVAVEFDEFAVVIDGLQNDNRVRELIRLTHEAIPNKPIRYVVVTHSHFDHASGLRDFVAEGAVVVTHEANVEFFERALSAPRTLAADRTLRRPGGSVTVQGVSGRHVISDDSGQAIELLAIEGSMHADDMLVAYLPRVKAIVESDLLQPWINPVFGGGGHPYLVHLHGELERLGVDYGQFVPIHTPPEPPAMPKSALIEAVRR